MRTNEIAMSFLKCKDKILIVRRKSSIYRWEWAGISAFVESGITPLESAMREIKKETKLDEGDFNLIRKGRSFSFCEDEDEFEIKWTFHPLLFSVKTEKIKIDGKHETKWIKPDELCEYFTVTKLGKCLEKVIS